MKKNLLNDEERLREIEEVKFNIERTKKYVEDVLKYLNIAESEILDLQRNGVKKIRRKHVRKQ